MFEGHAGKDLMIRQGYMPPTCSLLAEYAGPLIYSEISKGRSPCWACDGDRLVCKGQPRRVAVVVERKL